MTTANGTTGSTVYKGRFKDITTEAGAFAAIGAGRDEIKLPPEDVCVVVDPTHPLYDPRATYDLDPAFTAAIVAGVDLPQITLRRNGTRLEVVDGRQRARHMVAANVELRRLGREPRVLYAIVRRYANDLEAHEDMLRLNFRREDPPSVTGEKIHGLARAWEAAGKPHGPSDLAAFFGKSVSWVKSHLALLDAAPEVRKAVDVKGPGSIGLAAAADLARSTPREKQGAVLDKMREQGVTRGKAARRAARSGGEDAAPVPKVKHRGYIERFAAALSGMDAPDAKAGEAVQAAMAVAAHFVGDDSALKRIPWLVEAAKMAGRDKRKDKRGAA